MNLYPTRNTISDCVNGRNDKVYAFLIAAMILFVYMRAIPNTHEEIAGIDLTSQEDTELYRKLSSPRTQADVEQMKAIMSRQIEVTPRVTGTALNN
jgi:hypothetical protein